MNMIWFSSLALIISSYWRELEADQLRRRQLAAGLRHVVGDHPAPPDVLRANPVALPELQHDQRRADLLAGQQLEMRQFLAGAQVQAARRVARRTRPPTGPASRRRRSALRRAIPG